MSDNISETTTTTSNNETTTSLATKMKGFFKDEEGDLSSGRLIKIIAAISACLIGIGCVFIVAFSPVDVEKIKTLVSIVVALIGLAGASEITQKVTGK